MCTCVQEAGAAVVGSGELHGVGLGIGLWCSGRAASALGVFSSIL